MKTITRVFAAALFLSIATAALAEQHQNHEKGFKPERVYSLTGLDSVNVYNGNLTLRIPIGGQYPNDGGMAWGLTLTYNSKLWEYEETYGVFDNVTRLYLQSIPERRSNAGFGWLLSLGRLIDPDDPIWDNAQADQVTFIYEGPDGADHDVGGAGGATTGFSRDGSYLRMRLDAANANKRYIDFPDGSAHTFERTDTTSKRWWIKRMTDAFGNAVTISYDSPTTPTVWTIADKYREAKVYFRTIANLPATSNLARVVDRVELPAPSTQPSVYQFHYGAGVGVQVSRGCTFERMPDAVADSFVNVSLLSGITLPDGSQFSWQYYQTQTSSTCDQGAIKSMTVPTSGKTVWDYTLYNLTSGGCFDNFLNSSAGIYKRRFEKFDTSVASPADAEWTYSQQLDLASNCGQLCDDAQLPERLDWDWYHHHRPLGVRQKSQSKTTVTAPDGLKTVHYFNAVSMGDCELDETVVATDEEFGRPYTPRVKIDGSNGRKLALSTEVYPPTGVSGGTFTYDSAPARSSYLRYESDPDPNIEGETKINPRVASERTVFHDDGDHYSETVRSGWDNHGHYRRVTALGGPKLWGNAHSVYTEYTPIATTDKWILGTYTFVERTDGPTIKPVLDGGVLVEGEKQRTEFCFDQTNGFLMWRRTRRDASVDSANDVVAAFQHVAGNVTTESWFGGDTENAGTTSRTNCTPPTNAATYIIDHTYDFGALKTATYRGSGFFFSDLTVSSVTGLVSSSRDTAGEVTNYFYDAMSRLRWEKPTGRAWTEYTYANATASTPAQVTVTRRPNGSETGQLAQSRYTFDPFGRVTSEFVLMPNGTESERRTRYDAAGRVATVTSLGSLDHSTTLYDGFGRPKQVTAPDDKVTTFGYVGTRERSRTSSIATGSTETSSVTTERYDFRGRLVSVTEPSGTSSSTAPIGGLVTTEYTYDGDDHLTQVKMAAGDVVQERVFSYDGRGFLQWESHPESGMSSYTYDARGNVLSKNQAAANTPFDLRYTYDGAGRLTQLDGRDPDAHGQFRPIKKYFFSTANVAGTPENLSKGKLIEAIRFNYTPDRVFTPLTERYIIRVSEQYAYKDAAGRKTDRKTLIERGWDPSATTWALVKEISQSAVYNDLDLPATIHYPMCIPCGVPPVAPQRELSPTYTNGRTTALSGFISQMQYAPNGTRSLIQHLNNVADTTAPDPDGLPRPASISAGSYTACTAPVITVPPTGGQVSLASPAIDLTVTATGSSLTYQWYSGSAPISGATGATYTASPSSTTTYSVRVSSGACLTTSRIVTVSYNQCTNPQVLSTSAVLSPDRTVRLSANAIGTEPYSFTWYRTSDQAVVSSKQTETIGAISSTTSYYVTVSGPCGSPHTGTTVRVEVPLPAPTNVVASRTAASQILVSWSPVAGATKYVVQRRDHGGGWNEWLPQTATTLTDTSLAPNSTYAYRVIAVDAIGGSRSTPSNTDVATTMTFTPLAPGMTVTAAHMNELLAAVNAVRGASAWNELTWSTILAPDRQTPVSGNLVSAQHLITLRARMNEALHALGAPVAAYTDPDPKQKAIRAVHFTELQGRTQ